MKMPFKITWRSEIVPLAAVIGAVAVSATSYGSLPERVITHWNFYGQADGWSSRDFHVFFFPILLAGMYALFLFLPAIDPRKERYQEFAGTYNVIRGMIMSVLFLVYLVATLVNLGYDIDVSRTVPLLIGALMIVMGNYMGKLKSNWFVGIRTPWTLSSEKVWQKTHRLGGVLFVLFGLIMMAMPHLTRKYGMILFVIAISVTVLVPIVASYIFYKKEK